MITSTDDLRLLRAPSATYRRLAALPSHTPTRQRLLALARAAAPAAIVGVATAMMATGRVGWSLALSGALCWSFVAFVQMTTAFVLIRSSRRALPWARSIELFFLGHAAWSLWILALAAVLVAVPSAGRHQDVILLTFLIPALWTAVVIHAFCRQILELDVRRAAVKTALHQSITYAVIFLYIGWAVQLWPRAVATFGS